MDYLGYGLAKEIAIETIGYFQVVEPYKLQKFTIDKLEMILKKYSIKDS